MYSENLKFINLSLPSISSSISQGIAFASNSSTLYTCVTLRDILDISTLLELHTKLMIHHRPDAQANCKVDETTLGEIKAQDKFII